MTEIHALFFNFTTGCYIEHGIAMGSCPSVWRSACDVEVLWSHTLRFFENNSMSD